MTFFRNTLIWATAYKPVRTLETERMLKEWIEEHLRDVRQPAEKPLIWHLEGNKEEHVKVNILQKIFHYICKLIKMSQNK